MSRFDLRPQPRLGYSENPIDRAADRRTDEALMAMARDPRTRTLVIANELVVLKKQSETREAAFTFDEARALAPVHDSVFLGLRDGAAHFAAAIDQAAAEALKSRDDLHVTDVRSLALEGLISGEALAEVVQGKALLHWHARHGFCANCGARTTVMQGGWRRDCPACGVQHFPRTDPVVIMLAVRDDQCLLGRQSRFAQGMWSCLAGFVEPGESIEEATRRETLEEAGITCGRVTYFASQPWPFPMSLMIGCFAEALTSEITIDRAELEDARWFDRAEAAMMLDRSHPDKLWTPHPFAIAHHILRAWLEHPDVLG